MAKPIVLIVPGLGNSGPEHWQSRWEADEPTWCRLARLAFPSILIASRDDPYVSLARARFFADAWGSTFEDAGSLGHINAQSGIGRWEKGRTLLASLLVDRLPETPELA